MNSYRVILTYHPLNINIEAEEYPLFLVYAKFFIPWLILTEIQREIFLKCEGIKLIYKHKEKLALFRKI